MTNKVYLETKDYTVTVGEHEDFKQDVYLVTNTMTGVAEYATTVLPQAFDAAYQFQEHLDDMNMKMKAPTLSVVNKDISH